jgi:hypothetical protein
MSPRTRRKLLVAVTVLSTMVLAAACGNVGDDLVKAGKNLPKNLPEAQVTQIADQFGVDPQAVRSAGQQLDSGAAGGVVRTAQEVDNTDEGWRRMWVACKVNDGNEYLEANDQRKRELIIQAQGQGPDAYDAQFKLLADDMAKAKNAGEGAAKLHVAIMCAIADQKAGP